MPAHAAQRRCGRRAGDSAGDADLWEDLRGLLPRDGTGYTPVEASVDATLALLSSTFAPKPAGLLAGGELLKAAWRRVSEAGLEACARAQRAARACRTWWANSLQSGALAGWRQKLRVLVGALGRTSASHPESKLTAGRHSLGTRSPTPSVVPVPSPGPWAGSGSRPAAAHLAAGVNTAPVISAAGVHGWRPPTVTPSVSPLAAASLRGSANALTGAGNVQTVKERRALGGARAGAPAAAARWHVSVARAAPAAAGTAWAEGRRAGGWLAAAATLATPYVLDAVSLGSAVLGSALVLLQVVLVAGMTAVTTCGPWWGLRRRAACLSQLWNTERCARDHSYLFLAATPILQRHVLLGRAGCFTVNALG